MRDTSQVGVTRRGLAHAALVAALALLPACGIIGPEPRGLAGEWAGGWVTAQGNIVFALHLTTSGDSVHGTADTKAHFFVPSPYSIAGVRSGDDFELRLRPLGYPDINFAGRRYGDVISGEMWYDSDVDAASPVNFSRR